MDVSVYLLRAFSYLIYSPDTVLDIVQNTRVDMLYTSIEEVSFQSKPSML